MAVAPDVRVVIADDHAPTRAAVRAALTRGGFVVAGEAPAADGAVAVALATEADVVLLDIRMPGNGITAAARIAVARPDTSIVMLTVSQDDEDLFGALRAGAMGYMLKGVDPTEVPEALRTILRGEAVLSGSLVARVLEEFRSRERHRFRRPAMPEGAQLSDREWEVLDLMEQGLTTAEIGERLFVAPVTVRSHVAHILRKLQVPDRQAALKVVQDSRG